MNMSLWAPNDVETYLKATYDITKCSSSVYVHKIEKYADSVYHVDCRQLWSRDPFVFRSTTTSIPVVGQQNGGQVLEELKLGDRVLSSFRFDAVWPSHRTDTGFDYSGLLRWSIMTRRVIIYKLWYRCHFVNCIDNQVCRACIAVWPGRIFTRSPVYVYRRTRLCMSVFLCMSRKEPDVVWPRRLSQFARKYDCCILRALVQLVAITRNTAVRRSRPTAIGVPLVFMLSSQ